MEMKTLSAEKVLDAVLAKMLNCNFRDINKYVDAHLIVHPDVYVEVTRNDIIGAVQANPDKFHWEGGTIFRQELLLCPVCGDKHRKYPNQNLFEEIKKNVEACNSQ